MDKFVLRCRWTSCDGTERGVGYLNRRGSVSYKLDVTSLRFDSEAEAWDYAKVSGQLGRDGHGEFCWPEPLP